MRRRDGRGHIDIPEPPVPYRDLIGGRLCLDFVNTVTAHGEPGSDDDLYPGYGNLIAWSYHAGIVEEATAIALLRAARRQPRDAVQVRRRAVTLREAIHALALGNASTDAAAALDDEWRAATAHRRLKAVHGNRLAWAWDEGQDLDRPLWPVVASAIDLFTGNDPGRIRQCAAPDCEAIFLDVTRNGNRRFCRPQECGTRTRVQRFREAHRDTPDLARSLQDA